PFMAVTPTKLYAAGYTDMSVVPVTGGALTTFDLEPDGRTLPGNSGLAIGEAIYTISSARFDAASPAPLVYRFVDDTGTPALTPIDTSPLYTGTEKLGAITVAG